MTWQITASLTHDPYWSTLRMLSASCTQNQIVFERRERVGHRHRSYKVAVVTIRLGQGTATQYCEQ